MPENGTQCIVENKKGIRLAAVYCDGEYYTLAYDGILGILRKTLVERAVFIRRLDSLPEFKEECE